MFLRFKLSIFTKFTLTWFPFMFPHTHICAHTFRNVHAYMHVYGATWFISIRQHLMKMLRVFYIFCIYSKSKGIYDSIILKQSPTLLSSFPSGTRETWTYTIDSQNNNFLADGCLYQHHQREHSIHVLDER